MRRFKSVASAQRFLERPTSTGDADAERRGRQEEQ
jgi:hypothetical protein